MKVGDTKQIRWVWVVVAACAAVAVWFLFVASGNSEAASALTRLLGAAFQLAFYAAIVLLVIWVIRRGVSQGVKDANKQPSVSPPPVPDNHARPAAQHAGPGRYRITGINAATKDDVTMEISAQTKANARAKAEVGGVVVTEIECIGE